MKNWLQNLSNTIFYDIHFSDFAMKWRTESVITKGKEFEWNDSNELRHFFIFMRLNIMLDFRMNNSTDEIKYASKTVFRRDHKLWFITMNIHLIIRLWSVKASLVSLMWKRRGLWPSWYDLQCGLRNLGVEGLTLFLILMKILKISAETN